MSGESIVWVIMGGVLVVYVLTGGADFGAGLWALLARGPHAAKERDAIEKALAPIWEANHVWLIFLVVLCFTVFPVAFHVVSIALHIPIVCALVGIVLRGAAFVFRAYGVGSATRSRWGRVFAWSSTATPVFLGATLAALATGEIRFDGQTVRSGFFAGWTTPFAWATGAFSLSLFALLAAVYLTVETRGDLREIFRRNAIQAEIFAGLLAAAVLTLAFHEAPPIVEQLAQSPFMWPIQGVTAAAACAALYWLWRRAFAWARAAVVVQVVGVVAGFGVGMRGYLVYPDVSLHRAGSEAATLHALFWALPFGAVILLPSLIYLFRIFKGPSETTLRSQRKPGEGGG